MNGIIYPGFFSTLTLDIKFPTRHLEPTRHLIQKPELRMVVEHAKWSASVNGLPIETEKARHCNTGKYPLQCRVRRRLQYAISEKSPADNEVIKSGLVHSRRLANQTGFSYDNCPSVVNSRVPSSYWDTSRQSRPPSRRAVSFAACSGLERATDKVWIESPQCVFSLRIFMRETLCTKERLFKSNIWWTDEATESHKTVCIRLIPIGN